MTKAETINPRARAEWAITRGIKSGSRASIAFGEALREVRGALTQEEIAAKCGVSGSIWNTWESGRGLPGEASWRLLKAGLGRTAVTFIMSQVDVAMAASPNAGVPIAVKKAAVAKSGAKAAPKRQAVYVPPGEEDPHALPEYAKPSPDEDEYPFPDAGRAARRGVPEAGDPAYYVPGPPPVEEGRNVVRGADTDGVLAAVLGCGLPDRAKALLCAAVVAMAAGVDVEVEIRARA